MAAVASCLVSLEVMDMHGAERSTLGQLWVAQ